MTKKFILIIILISQSLISSELVKNKNDQIRFGIKISTKTYKYIDGSTTGNSFLHFYDTTNFKTLGIKEYKDTKSKNIASDILMQYGKKNLTTIGYEQYEIKNSFRNKVNFFVGRSVFRRYKDTDIKTSYLEQWITLANKHRIFDKGDLEIYALGGIDVALIETKVNDVSLQEELYLPNLGLQAYVKLFKYLSISSINKGFMMDKNIYFLTNSGVNISIIPNTALRVAYEYKEIKSNIKQNKIKSSDRKYNAMAISFRYTY